MKTRSSERGKSLRMEERDSSTGSQASEQGQKFDVFLSHSGEQKNFVRQLHRDLTNQGVSCFFDQDRDCLPLATQFPSRIFEAANTCQVALLLLSKDFLESKWPMLELSAFVEARDTTNPNLKILPLFFLISPDALKNTEEYDEKWKVTKVSPKERDEWQQALKAISDEIVNISPKERGDWGEALKALRPINGLRFEGGNEVKFRDEIVKEIWRILPMPSPRYPVRGMQGEARMCQEVANFFNKVQPIKGGVRIVGFYGIPGYGKTTLGKAFCNSQLKEFEGIVCHLEFGRGDPLDRAKHALQNLTHSPLLYVQTLTNEEQAKVELHKRVEGKRVLLVLDNITEESREEVRDYLGAKVGENSWIILSARSGEVLERISRIDRQSCMHVPSLKEEEAIQILLERASPVESTLNEEDRGSALKCAEKCLFSCDNGQSFHPLALKAFGGYLFSKYGLNLPTRVGEIDATALNEVFAVLGTAFDEVFAVLGTAFDDMAAKYRTIFMLLTVYNLPNMSRHKVIKWMAINCNEKMSFIEKALQNLREKAFIEELEPEIRIHDLYIEFAQMKADKMDRWLWWKQDQLVDDTRGLISEDKDGFELAKLEHCMYETIGPDYLRNLFVLQFVNVQDMRTVDFDPMKRLRSITLWDCKSLEALDGMEMLLDLAWLQIKGDVNPMFKLPDISRIRRLQHLEIDIANSQVICQLGDLSNCYRLRDVYVVCPSLIKFPRLKSMKHLEKVEFRLCDKVEGPLDCTDCANLQTIVLSNCCHVVASPMLTGCEKLENLKLVECGIREPPDLTGCKMLQNVYFYSLRNLKRFPNFSLLRELKNLSLCDCIGVKDPPDIEGCHKLEVFHLLYNDNMKGLSNMDECAQLEKIQVSWHSEDEVAYEGIDPDICQVNGELEFCPKYWEAGKFENIRNVRMPEGLKEVQCVKGKTILLKRYFRGARLYYTLRSPYVIFWKMVLKVTMENEKRKRKVLKIAAGVEGVVSVAVDMKENEITVIGEMDPVFLISKLRKYCLTEILSYGPAKEEKKGREVICLKEEMLL